VVPLPSAVLFDLDGTLVHSEPVWVAAKALVAARHGAHWDDDDAAWAEGRATPVYSARIASRATVEVETAVIEAEISAEVADAMRTGEHWKPSALDALERLRGLGVRTALVTLSYRAIVDALIASDPRARFDVVVAGDEIARPKPDPEGYLRAAADLGVAPADCVVVEDSAVGARAGLAAAVRRVLVVGAPGPAGSTSVPSIGDAAFWAAVGS
jgi:HAD superfamily hydrolase (TIGR01509 family)